MNLNVPAKTHAAFKAATAAQGENMTDVVLEFIRQYVEKYKASEKKGRRA